MDLTNVSLALYIIQIFVMHTQEMSYTLSSFLKL